MRPLKRGGCGGAFRAPPSRLRATSGQGQSEMVPSPRRRKLSERLFFFDLMRGFLSPKSIV